MKVTGVARTYCIAVVRLETCLHLIESWAAGIGSAEVGK